ncbi:serine/threonine protein kinase [bacterium]|nr:MAG: serine/threonine protein kinase [bacterium]
MLTYPNKGDKLFLGSTKTYCVVGDLLGDGGQGRVVQVMLDGQPYAVKWYHPYYHAHDPGLYERLRQAIDQGAPNASFLWPIETVSSPDVSGFGYLMRLRDARYRGLSDLKWGKDHKRYVRRTNRILATIGYNIAECYQCLHLKGMCYVDLNEKNVFFNPADGDTLICDNDNVDFDSQAKLEVGTPGFMAPEVQRGEARPNVLSDFHALAVLLFELFMLHHPLMGRASLKYPIEDVGIPKLFGTNPVFIFDPKDDSNRALASGEHPEAAFAGAIAVPRWRVLPSFMQDLFVKAFGDGLHTPQARVTEGTWRRAFLRLRDLTFPCANPDCGNDNYFDPERFKSQPGPPKCAYCGQPLKKPVRMRIDNRLVMMNLGVSLYPYHIDSGRPFDLAKPIGIVAAHPLKAGVIGLRNLSDTNWSSTLPSGESVDVPPGKSALLETGVTISFGRATGEVRR